MSALTSRRCPLSLVVLAAFLFFVSTATLYGRLHFYRDPGSIFFDQSRAFERHYSTYRENQAHAFTSRTKARQTLGQTSKGPTAGDNPRMCMVLLTTARDTSDPTLGVDPLAEARHVDTVYTELAISSLLAGLTPSERADLSLQVFFANTEPKVHPLYSSPWIEFVTDATFTSDDVVSSDAMAHLTALEADKNWHEKSTNDYATAIQRCYDETTAPYITILEGDVLVADGWLARTLLSLQSLSTQKGNDTRREQWLDLRLFNQERSTGFDSHDWTGNNVPVIAFGVSILVGGILLSLRRVWRKTALWLDNATLGVICLIVVPATVALFFRSGKASVLPRSPGIYEENFGCCSQGLVFNRAVAPKLMEYLRQHAGPDGYDMITRDFGRQEHLSRWAQYPMLLQHLGVHSIMSWDRPIDQIVWSMAFEDLDARGRDRDHARSVRELYGNDAWTKG